MKKLYLLVILIIIVNISLFSEEIEIFPKEKEIKFTIQTSPHYYFINLINGGDFFIIDLEGQYKINALFNVSLAFSFLFDAGLRNTITSYNVENYQIHLKPMFIYRPFKTGLKGAYIGVYPIIGFLSNPVWTWGDKYKNEYDLYRYEIGMGLDIGYKWIFNNGFTLQFGGGIGNTWLLPFPTIYYYYSEITSDGRVKLKYYDLSLDIKIGYSF